jgi:hypothetical protein
VRGGAVRAGRARGPRRLMQPCPPLSDLPARDRVPPAHGIHRSHIYPWQSIGTARGTGWNLHELCAFLVRPFARAFTVKRRLREVTAGEIRAVACDPKKSSWPTTKSTKNARKGTWEREALHPPGDHTRLPNRRFLFGFSAFSVVELLPLG